MTAMLKLSGNKSLLLRLFYTNPDQEYYVQEIGRILDKKPGVFQRALYNLESEGVLMSEYKANARYFRANKNYPLYKEYKSIISKTIGVVGSIQEILEKTGSIDFSFLYGSFAKGKENYLSDIDLVIIGFPEENKIVREFDKLEKELSRDINYKLYTFNEFVESVLCKDPFLLEILKGQKTMLIGAENKLRKIVEGSTNKEAKPGSRADKKSVEKGKKRLVDGRSRSSH
jgi:predicted nucleotidyltransferase